MDSIRTESMIPASSPFKRFVRDTGKLGVRVEERRTILDRKLQGHRRWASGIIKELRLSRRPRECRALPPLSREVYLH
jgi:hypothetical protein